MKKIIFSALLTALCITCFSQSSLYVSPGANITITNGTYVTIDGLQLKPSVDYNITGENSVTRDAIATPPPPTTYINRVYHLLQTLPAYSGDITLYYQDSELNGLNKDSLNLNLYTGTSWNTYPTTSRDAANNFVTTAGLSGVVFNQATLAAPLPPKPTLACYQTATFDAKTAQWIVSGTQPAKPQTVCYETATFNTTTCAWDVTGIIPPKPLIACYQTATFNNQTCAWDVSGTQPAKPTTMCSETAVFNTATCQWEGSQAPTYYKDADGDGYYTGSGVVSCTSPGAGYKYTGLVSGGDCNDANAAVHPGATEICSNGIDDNCNGQTDEGCTVAVPYTLSINDVSMNEGNKGKSNMIFTVTLNKAWNTKVTVQYTTQNGTAMAGSDYTAKSGTLTFKPGSTKQTVAIPFIADKTVEPNETFTVVLSNPVNAVLSKSTGTGTIVNDDGTITTTMQAVDAKALTLEVDSKLAVTVAPNPSHSYFTLHTQSGSNKVLQVRTVDALGRVIETRGNVPANGTLMLGGNYSPGIYFTEVLQGNQRIILKLIKQSN